MISAVFTIFESKYNKNIKYLIVFISLVPLSIVASMRIIGTDTNNYKEIFANQEIINFFNYSLTDIFSFNLEPGFLMIISFLKTLSLDYYVMFFLFFTIPTLLIIRVINKANIKNVLVVYLLFLLAYLLKGPMDIIRHFFAAALYLTSLLAISQGKKLWSYFIIAVASFFHYSSVISFFILILLKIKWGIKKYIFILISSFTLGLLLKDILLNRIGSMSTVGQLTFVRKIQSYVDVRFSSDDMYVNILLNLITIMPIVMNILIAIYGLYFFSKVNNRLFKTLLNAQIMGTIITVFIMAIGATTAGYRMDFYLSIGNFILMYYIIIYSNKSKQKYIFLMFVYYLLVCNIVLVLHFIS